ncbi:MAG: hypothetical protein RL071_2359, partial [Pseudomonadota bacterium]
MRLLLHASLFAALLTPAACAPRDDTTDPQPEPADSAAPAADGAEPGPDCAAAPLDCDGINNDCDGQTDEGAEVEGRILSGEDRDGDGWSTEAPTLACPPVGVPAAPLAGGGDCADRDAARSPGNPEDCLRAGDEDCDGLIDCADLDCAGLPCLEDCADGVDNDLDGLTDCADPRCNGPRCPELCGDGIDNDADRTTDCADADCSSVDCAELCRDGDDNDADGLIDCRDPDCWGASCPEDCALDGDEDADGLADCEDADCTTACTERCDDVDRDRDGLVGCDDPDCGLLLECWSELRGGAEGLRLDLSVQIIRSFRWEGAAVLGADALWLSGVAHTASGAPIDCAVSLHDLTARIHRSSTRGGSYTRPGGEGPSTAAFSADPLLHPDCPFVGIGDVTVDALHRASYPSDWALLPGDVHRMLQLRQASPAGTRLGWISLFVTAQTGSTVGTSPSGGLSEARQVL